MKSYNASDLKDLNREIVYRLLEKKKEIFRAEIARLTGISTPTVLKIISYFLELGLVSEEGECKPSLGRKPQMLRFNADARFSIGVEYEGDFLKVGIVNLEGDLKTSKQKRVSGHFTEVMQKECIPLIKGIVDSSGISWEKIMGVGIGVPAIVDIKNNIVSAAPLVGILHDVDCKPILQELKNQLGLDAFIENDANAGALGEFTIRKLTDASDLVYISLGTGLGAGVVLQGKLRRGVWNSSGEIGYMVYDKNFITSTERSGWLESQVNAHALTKRWPFFSQLFEGESWKKFETTSDFHLLIDHVAGNLALCIANIYSILDVDVVVLGGISVKLLGPLLIESINRYLSRLNSRNITCQLQKSPEPSVVGAATIAIKEKLKEIFSG
ncbi:MAG TPA: ROK family protein [Clostridiaceae bacterium]|nr:ROK family protein [Clostridiaceae bacterium]